MSGKDKIISEIYGGMSVEDKFDAVGVLFLVAKVNGRDPQKEVGFIGNTLSNFEKWKWSNLFGQYMVDMVEYLELELKKWKLLCLKEALMGDYTFLFMAKEKDRKPHFFERLKRNRDAVPTVLKELKLWKIEYENHTGMGYIPELTILERAIEDLNNRMDECAYTKQLSKNFKAAFEILNAQETSDDTQS